MPDAPSPEDGASGDSAKRYPLECREANEKTLAQAVSQGLGTRDPVGGSGGRTPSPPAPGNGG